MANETSVVMTVPEAGAKLGLGRNAAYEAAARGDIPTIRIGKLLRVPVIAFDRMLEAAGKQKPDRSE
jgi:excisionase family DNA binding protein